MRTDPNIEDFANSNNPVVRKFSDYLDAHALRRTTERYAILNRIMNINGHFTVEELQQLLDIDGFRVSRSTVYNTIELLIEAKLLRRHVFEGMQAQYERITLPHTHLICTSCGKIKEVRDPNLALLRQNQGSEGPQPGRLHECPTVQRLQHRPLQPLCVWHLQHLCTQVETQPPGNP